MQIAEDTFFGSMEKCISKWQAGYSL